MESLNSPVLFSGSTADITPVKPVHLAGYQVVRNAPFDRINDPLEINVILLRHQERKIFIVSIDALFTSHELKTEAIRELNRKHGENIREEDFIFNASHTHFAPPVEAGKPMLGELNNEYLLSVKEKLFHTLEQVLSEPGTPVTMHLHHFNTDHTINRRRKIINLSLRRFPSISYKNAYAPLGKKNRNGSVIEFKNRESQTVGLIWHFACHPVAFYEFNTLSADFPGAVRTKLRNSTGKNISVCFLQGFAGDIRPRFGKLTRWDYLKSLLLLPQKIPASTEKIYAEWTLSLSRAVIECLNVNSPEIAVSRMETAIIKKPLSEIFEGENTVNKYLYFQAVQFSDQLSIACISAEPLIEYEDLLKGIAGKGTLLCGYTDSVHLYLPTDRQVKEGGYEADGFIPLFSLKGKFRNEVQEKIISAFKELFISWH